MLGQSHSIWTSSEAAHHSLQNTANECVYVCVCLLDCVLVFKPVCVCVCVCIQASGAIVELNCLSAVVAVHASDDLAVVKEQSMDFIFSLLLLCVY